MRMHTTWLGKLSLAVGLFWANATPAPAQNSMLCRRTAANIPVKEMSPPVRSKVERVIEAPTLFSLGPSEAFAGQPLLYHWLLEHPDRAMEAWRRLGAKCTLIKDMGSGRFRWTDGRGSQIDWVTAHNDPRRQIWYAEGVMRPGLLLPSVPVQAVLVLHHGEHKSSSDGTLIYHQADVFLKTDSNAAMMITRALGPSASHMTEQFLGQLEAFFSCLVWYLDQHPDRVERLLAAAR
jgi:hypothetical protein